MAGISACPLIPLLFNQRIQPIIKLAAAHHLHLRLMLDASANNVVADCPQRCLGKIRITNQLASAIPKKSKAVPDFTIGTGAKADPIRSKAVAGNSGISTLEI